MSATEIKTYKPLPEWKHAPDYPGGWVFWTNDKVERSARIMRIVKIDKFQDGRDFKYYDDLSGYLPLAPLLEQFSEGRWYGPLPTDGQGFIEREMARHVESVEAVT